MFYSEALDIGRYPQERQELADDHRRVWQGYHDGTLAAAMIRKRDHSFLQEVGLSLFASCLNYWLELDLEERPHVIASSHFHSLPTFLSQPETVAFQVETNRSTAT